MAGFWSIIVPEATTNLVTNPSIEIDTTGYTAVGSAISRQTTVQKREVACLRIIPTAAVNDGAYYGTVSLTDGQSYTFSVDIKGTSGKPYKIYFEDGTTTEFTANGEWERQEITWVCDSTSTYRLYMTKNNDNNTDPFYIDGVQCENLAYATTYVDGNQEGCKWAGVEHASTSERDAQNRIGGRVYNLDDYGFYIDDMPGIGMPPILHQTQEQPMLPGSLLRGSKTKPRIFDLIANQIGDTHEDLHSKRKDLLNAIKPDLVLEPQDFILRYTGANANKPVEIRCIYDSGYQFTKLDGFVERQLPLRFIAYEQPYFQEIGNAAKSIGTKVSVTNANRIIRKIDGVWSEMDQGTGSTVYSAIAKGFNDGYIYVGGGFTSVGGGVSNTAKIARWDGDSWSAMGTGGSTGSVIAMAVASDGSVYVGGSFPAMGGVGNTGYIACWDGSSWNPVGTGMDDNVWALAIDQDGILYAAGEFLDAGGTAANRIAYWDGSSWTAMGTGCNGLVYALAVATNNNIYAGGDFTTAGGETVNRIAEWDGSSWAPVGASGMNGTVNALAVKDDGKLAAQGGFTTANAVPANYIAIWNGASWSALQSGFNTGSAGTLHWAGNLLYAGGAHTVAGGIAVEKIAIWNGTTWTHLDANLPGTPTVKAILYDKGDLYLGYDSAGTATTSYSQTVTNDGTRTAYPKIVIGRVGGTTAIVKWLRNETTNVTIYMDYSLQDGETLTLDLAESKRSLTSSYKGDIWQAALRSSYITGLSLLPGDNNISVYVSETGDPTVTAYMQWRNTHWSADGVAV